MAWLNLSWLKIISETPASVPETNNLDSTTPIEQTPSTQSTQPEVKEEKKEEAQSRPSFAFSLSSLKEQNWLATPVAVSEEVVPVEVIVNEEPKEEIVSSNSEGWSIISTSTNINIQDNTVKEEENKELFVSFNPIDEFDKELNDLLKSDSESQFKAINKNELTKESAKEETVTDTAVEVEEVAPVETAEEAKTEEVAVTPEKAEEIKKWLSKERKPGWIKSINKRLFWIIWIWFFTIIFAFFWMKWIHKSNVNEAELSKLWIMSWSTSNNIIIKKVDYKVWVDFTVIKNNKKNIKKVKTTSDIPTSSSWNISSWSMAISGSTSPIKIETLTWSTTKSWSTLSWSVKSTTIAPYNPTYSKTKYAPKYKYPVKK